MSNEKDTAWATFNYGLEFELPLWVVDSCPQSGDCTNAIQEFLQDKEIASILDSLDPDLIARELREYGAWDETELQNHQENKERILWIAIGNIWDEQ